MVVTGYRSDDTNTKSDDASERLVSMRGISKHMDRLEEVANKDGRSKGRMCEVQGHTYDFVCELEFVRRP